MMRTSPYPVPPSRIWSLVMALTYLALAVAGGLVLALLAIVPQAGAGGLVLVLWGGLTLVGSLACLWGVVRSRYRWEWVGTWIAAMGTAVYLVVTIMGTTGLGLLAFLQSLPTILVFVALVGSLLARAIQLSLIDLRARQQVIASRTGEIPQVVADE